MHRTCHTLFALLEAEANPENAFWMEAYARNKFRFLGVHAPQRKTLDKAVILRLKAAGEVDWAFVAGCWENPYREMQYAALDYLRTVQKALTPDDLPRIRHLIQTKSWWDTVDGLHGVVGNIALRHPRVNATLLKWSQAEDLWLRRVAIDHQIGRKERTDTALLEEILCNNFGTNEFFIDKAIGWSLRSYAKTNPAWVRAFIDRYGDRMARLSLREAGKYL